MPDDGRPATQAFPAIIATRGSAASRAATIGCIVASTGPRPVRQGGLVGCRGCPDWNRAPASGAGGRYRPARVFRAVHASTLAAALGVLVAGALVGAGALVAAAASPALAPASSAPGAPGVSGLPSPRLTQASRPSHAPPWRPGRDRGAGPSTTPAIRGPSCRPRRRCFSRHPWRSRPSATRSWHRPCRSTPRATLGPPTSPDDTPSDQLRLRLKRVIDRRQHPQVGRVQPARPVLRPEQRVPPHHHGV